jgi:hypothetical protein
MRFYSQPYIYFIQLLFSTLLSAALKLAVYKMARPLGIDGYEWQAYKEATCLPGYCDRRVIISNLELLAVNLQAGWHSKPGIC